ncbi:MAG: SPOR domain-containing protein, partial [Deltaproteobacteria bacterium]|nr:SPOR domain-containing protein [Deltaproteobacteria bacterium]
MEIKGNDHVQCPVCSSELVELGDGETAENSATEEKESQLSELVDDLHRKLDEGEEAAGDAQPEDDAEPRDDEDITAEEIEYIMDEVDEEIVDESVEEKTSPGRQSRTALIVLGVIVVLAVAAYVLMSGRAPVERPSPTPVVKQRKEVLQKILKRDAQPAAVVVSNDKPADAQLPGVGAVARREVPAAPAAQPVVAKPDAPQETSPLTALRQEVASRQQPGPAVAQDRPDVAVSSQTVSGAPYFTLQVATMSNKQNAVKYYTELKAKGYRVYIVSKSVVPGKVFSKIRIGSFKTQVAAAAVARDLLEKEKI